jgi:hypothetical protein
MMRNLFFAVVALAASVAAPAPAPVLDDASFARWRDAIRPAPEELRWQEIPWRATFWEAVLEAQKKEQPLLVWAMNGHPLACT